MNKERVAFVLSGLIALLLVVGGRPVEAIPPAQSPTPTLMEQAKALRGEALTLYQQGEFQSALEKLQQALSLSREADDEEGEATSLMAISLVYEHLNDYEQSLTYSKQALAIYREIGNQEMEAWMLRGIGDVYRDLSEYEQALAYYQEELLVRQEIGDQEEEAATLYRMGLIYRDLYNYRQALAYLEQALSIRREIGDREGEGATLHKIGSVSYDMGDYKQALAYFEQALSIRREIGDREGEGATLNGLGLAYHDLSDYEQALAYYEQALLIAREIPDRKLEATPLHNIGDVYSDLGDYEKALAYYEQALAIDHEMSDQAGEANALYSIGMINYYLGNYKEALAYYRQALAIRQELDDQAEEGVVLNGIGAVYSSLGEYEQALDYHRQALTIAKDVGDRLGEGTRLNNIGYVYSLLRQYEQALDYLQKALAIRQEIGDRAGEVVTLKTISAIYYVLGQYEQALDYGQQAIDVIESIQGDIKIEEFKISFVGQHLGIYESLIGFLWEEERFEEAFNYVERARARAFLDQLGNQRVDIRAGADAALLAQEETLRGEMAALETSLRQEWAKPQAQRRDEVINSLVTQLESKRDQYEELLTQLKLQNPEYASLVSVAPLTLAEVQNLLDEQTTLIEYFVTEDRTLAFVLTQDSLEVVEIEVARDELADRIFYLREIIPLRQPEAEQESAQGLYDLLIKPLPIGASHLRLGIVPHGPLHYLPFAALRDGDTYLIQKHSLFFLPSASVLQFVLDKRKPGADTLLALGNPVTDLAPLPFAENEAQAIAALYDTTPLIGSEASESQLRAQAADHGLVHIAAHGSFNPYNPLFSAVHLAADAEHDGRLEVHEVYGLDLARADLVVLSACDTQRGRLTEGDEIIGLNRAFIYAGTPSIVGSLWPVDDAATAELMEGFYRRMREGYSKAEALRGAQIEMAEEKEEAYYWAGFSLVGDWGIGKELEVEVEVTATPTEAVPEPTSTPTPTAKPTVTPTEAIIEPTATPAEKGGGLCGGSTALLMVGLVGVWLSQASGRPRTLR